MSSDPYDAAVLAESLRQLGRLDQARAVLAEALGEHPDSPVLLTELSAVLRRQGDLRGAERAARDAVALSPTTPLFLLRLCGVLLEQGRGDDAAQVAQSVIALDPQLASAWSNLALAGAGKRRPADRVIARNAYRRAIELAPGESGFRATAAVVEHAFGNDDEARRLIASGLAFDPQSRTLLELRAEYAPVGQQPALLVDVLTANPGNDESRELLDAAVTWERRVALTAALGLPVLLAVVIELHAAPVAVGVVTALAGGAGWLVLRRYRRRLAVLPAGYLAARAAAARGAAAIRALLIATTAAAVASALASWVAPRFSAALIALALLLGAAAVIAGMPDDLFVLKTARRRSGRVRGGTAWRYGGLRQELTLWSALSIGLVGLIGGSGLRASDPPGAGAVVVATAIVTALLLVEAAATGVNAPHRYLRALGLRYRFVVGAIMTFGLLSIAAAGGLSSAFDSSGDPPGSPLTDHPFPTITVPTFTVPTFAVPTFNVPTFTPLAPATPFTVEPLTATPTPSP